MRDAPDVTLRWNPARGRTGIPGMTAAGGAEGDHLRFTTSAALFDAIPRALSTTAATAVRRVGRWPVRACVRFTAKSPYLRRSPAAVVKANS